MPNNDLGNVLGMLLLIDRLAAALQSIGSRVRAAIREGRLIDDAELDAQGDAVEAALIEARAEIARKRAAGDA